MMTQKNNRYCSCFTQLCFALILLLQTSICANAAVVINGTRLVYKSTDREATIRLNNSGDQPALVQVWIDSGDARSTPDTASAPFIVSPPIFRINAEKGQTLRVVFTGEPLPEDKESVFWLNVLDVPPAPQNVEQDANFMQLAIRSRIKIFYRPKNLADSAENAGGKVQWSVVQNKDSYILRASNPSAYYVSLGKATLKLAQKDYEVNAEMMAPGASVDFSILLVSKEFATELSKTPVPRVDYVAINDFGVPVQHTVDAKFVK